MLSVLFKNMEYNYIIYSVNEFWLEYSLNLVHNLCPSSPHDLCCSVIPDENPSDLGDTIFSAPALLVIIIIVFLKSITLPVESVICPSSSTCKSTLNTSGWAFSTSSKKNYRVWISSYLLTKLSSLIISNISRR